MLYKYKTLNYVTGTPDVLNNYIFNKIECNERYNTKNIKNKYAIRDIEKLQNYNSEIDAAQNKIDNFSDLNK